MDAENSELLKEVAELRRRLRASEERFALFMEHLPGAAWMKDLEGRYVYANTEGERIFHRTLAELCGKTDDEVFPPETAAQFKENDRLALRNGKGLQTIEILPQEDGLHYSVVYKFPILDQSGKSVMVGGIAIDVSEQRKAEEQYRILADAVPDIVFTSDENGQCDYCNQRWYDYTGMTFEQTKENGWLSAIHPDDLERPLTFLEKAIQTGTPFEAEFRFRRADGTYRWFLDRGVPIRDGQGHIVKWLGTATDIDDLKNAEEVLRQKLREIVFQTDRAGRLTFLNQVWTDILGYSRTESLGLSILKFLEPADCDLGADLILGLGIGPRCSTTELRFQHKAGHTVWLEFSASPGDEHFVGGSLIDITERKKAERDLRELSGRILRIQDDERRRLARELHDSTAQSLAAVMPNLSLVQQSAARLSEKARKALSESLHMTEQCLQEIRTISYLLHPPLLDELGLSAALKWYVDGFAKRSGIGVTLDIPQELGRLPEDIETTVFRVVQEGLTNVYRHSGSPSAAVLVARTTSELSVEIRDGGKGMPAETAGPGSMASQLGIGIAGMRERVAQFNGSLRIQSGERGTVIMATIPLGDGLNIPI